jgi:hypothetical protein
VTRFIGKTKMRLIGKRINGLGVENGKFDSSQEITNLKNFNLYSNLSTVFEN